MALRAASTAKECPIEDKHILFLLYDKVHGKPLPNDGISVHECDLYGEKNPWEIWEAFRGGDDNNNGPRELYLFSTIKKESSRTSGSGSWEDQHNDVIIVVEGTNQRVAVKKCFRFDKSGTNNDGAWTMHEYSLDSSMLTPPSENYDYVLCKLIKNQGIRIRLKLSKERTAGQEVATRPRTRQSPSLALAASAAVSTANNSSGGLRPIKSANVQPQVEVGGKRIKVEETTAEERPKKRKKGKRPQQVAGDKKINVEEKTDDDDDDYEEHLDDNLSWPQFFSIQLIKSNKGAVKREEEDIKLLPNPFSSDLLLERLDIN